MPPCNALVFVFFLVLNLDVQVVFLRMVTICQYPGNGNWFRAGTMAMTQDHLGKVGHVVTPRISF